MKTSIVNLCIQIKNHFRFYRTMPTKNFALFFSFEFFLLLIGIGHYLWKLGRINDQSFDFLMDMTICIVLLVLLYFKAQLVQLFRAFSKQVEEQKLHDTKREKSEQNRCSVIDLACHEMENNLFPVTGTLAHLAENNLLETICSKGEHWKIEAPPVNVEPQELDDIMNMSTIEQGRKQLPLPCSVLYGSCEKSTPMFSNICEATKSHQRSFSNCSQLKLDLLSKSHTNGTMVLVVDDNVLNRKLIGRMLSHFGLDHRVAVDGQEAVKIIMSSQHVTGNKQDSNFGLIIMDMEMPVMDGVEAIRILRSRGIDLPIIALTANPTDTMRFEALQAGASEFGTKPILRQNLYEKCSRYIEIA